MKATKNSTPRVVCPEGTHIAQLIHILDWGTVTDKHGDRRKVEFIWETPEETHEWDPEKGEQPFLLDRKVALTIGKKSALKEIIEGVTGKKVETDEYELETLLLSVCQVNVVNEEDGDYTNAQITSYMPLSKNDAKRKFKPTLPALILDLDNFDQEVWDEMMEYPHLKWRLEKIMQSPEYKAIMGSKAAADKGKSKQAPAATTKGKATAATKAAAKGKATAAKQKAGRLLGK
jgi:hypothetical protein